MKTSIESSSMQGKNKDKAIPEWTLKADYIETCNCDYGCPCNFTGFPSNGFCSALVGYHIREGNYGRLKLDNLDVVDAYSWPKAIHEGNGTHQIFITNKISEQEQKDAIINIFSGKAKGNGHFALFAPTIKYQLDPKYVDIHMNVDGRKSSFTVPGVIDVKLENFVNPVTGDEQDTKIQLPKGFIWKLADAAKTKIMRISTLSLNFNHSGKNAFYSVVEFQGP
jgi:hypothetical protein